MAQYFVMSNGERVEGSVYRENDEQIEVRMANGSEAILPKAEIVDRGEVRRRDERERSE